MSISGWKFTSNEIRIAANCKNIDYERAIRETLKGINAEIKNVYNALKDYNSDLSSKYKFFINEDISFDDIKNDGSYIFDNIEFKIDYKSILTLLMGEKLYNSPEIALRELLQNSIDAINFRKRLQKESFEPKIEINFDGQTLAISDNGIGMDEYIFKKYFLNVGKSFYKSKDASSLVTDYDSISEFGIGVLSSFMVADSIEIESKKFSEDTNNPHAPICIEVPTAYGYMIKKKSFKQQVGTKITLKLKENHPFKSITELISKISPFVNYNITVIENDKEIILKPKVINKSLADEIMKPYKCDVCLEIDFSKSDNEVLKDIEGKVFFISPKSNNYNMDDWSYKLKRFTYQNGFLIENPRDKYSNELDIFPHCGDAVIVANFKGKSRLNVSVDRSRFIEDDKYRMIEKLIEQEIAKKLYEYLLPYHEKFSVEKYYKLQYEFLSKFSINLDFFLDKQKLSTIIYVGLFTNEGTIKYISLSKLLEYDLIIHPGIFYNKKDPYDYSFNRIELIKELKQIFVKDFKIPVLGLSASNLNVDSLFFGDRQPFIDALILTETNYYGIVELLNITIKEDAEADFIEKLGEFRFVKNIFSPKKNNIPLFAQHEFENIYFNLGHNFFKSFLNKEYYSFEEKNKLIASLSPLLEINIYNAKRKYKQIFKKVWKNLIKNEIITKDIEMPELSANDLPLIQLR